MKELTTKAINNAYAELLKDGAPKKYVYELHLFVHLILEAALKEGVIPKNAADAATPPKARPNSQAFRGRQSRNESC